MGVKRPIIGITAAYDFEKSTSNLREDYYEAVISCGGIPVLLPVTEDKSVWEEMTRICDGFILSGGPDVDASFFGESNMPYGGEISPVRDQMEIFISKQVIALDKPLLGICRGCQVLNIAAGGSIFQDIYAENTGGEKLLMHSQQAPRWFEIHTARIERATLLYDIYQTENIKVNSFHHQAVRDVASEFIINAYSEDHMIEAVSHGNKKFVLGVQWHPENLWRRNPLHLKLFERLVAVC